MTVRPPFMQAPDRGKPHISSSPMIPVSIKKQAEALVIQAAREFTRTHIAFDDPEGARLIEAVRVLNTLEP